MTLRYLSSSSSDDDVEIIGEIKPEQPEILGHRKMENSNTIEFQIKYPGISTPIWEEFSELREHHTELLIKYLNTQQSNSVELKDIEEQTDFEFSAKKTKKVRNVLLNSATEESMLPQPKINVTDHFTRPVKILKVDKQNKSVSYLDGKNRAHFVPIDDFVKTDPVIFCDYIANSYFQTPNSQNSN